MKVAAKKKEDVFETLPEMEVTSEDLQAINDILNKEGRKRSSLINILHDLQNKYYYLPKELLEIISRELDMPFNQVYGIATFFSAFFMSPLGDYRVRVCDGTTCFNEGAREIIRSLEDTLEIGIGETREDGKFSLMSAHCLGCCSIAPVMEVNEDIYGDLTPKKASRIVEDLEEEELEITDELIEEAVEYIKNKGGKISVQKASKDLDLTKDQFKKLINELKSNKIISEK